MAWILFSDAACGAPDAQIRPLTSVLQYDRMWNVNCRRKYEVMRSFDQAELTKCQQAAHLRPYCGPKLTSWCEGGMRIRLVQKGRFTRPKTETHDEFIIGHLKYVLGKDWGELQAKLTAEEQHAVMRWMFEAVEEQKRILPVDHKDGELFAAKPTGYVLALLSLGEDILHLLLVDRLPDALLNRLRSKAEFQGARYEIALAAAFVRAGFTVAWIETEQKHAEFTALLEESGETILVEAKSRHRPGILHEPGELPDVTSLRADVNRLYHRALKKPTNGLPYLIGIDVNLPIPDSAGGTPEWACDLRNLLERNPECTEENPAEEFCLVLSNYGWYYSGLRRAPPHELVWTFPQWSFQVLSDERTVIALMQALEQYAKRPECAFGVAS